MINVLLAALFLSLAGTQAQRIDTVTFTEGSAYGIHILTDPHRLQISDGDTSGNDSHYVTDVKVLLNVTLCGQLDYNDTTCIGDFLYWIKEIPDERIEIAKVGHGNTMNEFVLEVKTQGSVKNKADAAALDDAYEKFISNIRYITNADEPTLYCDNGTQTFDRKIYIMVTDSKSPPETTFVTTTVNIQTINDHKPVINFDLEPGENCLEPSSHRGRRAPQEREPSVSFSQSTEDAPAASELSVHGFSDDGAMISGSAIRVTFTNDTDEPRVLEHDQLSQLVKLKPPALAKQPHLAFWETPKHLIIVYPIVDEGAKVAAKDILLKFKSGTCSISGCCARGAFSDEPMSRDDIEQTQLHDWVLISFSLAVFAAVVAIVVYLGCTRRGRSGK